MAWLRVQLKPATQRRFKVTQASFAFHSHTKAEVKIRYKSVGGWGWMDCKANLHPLGKSPAQGNTGGEQSHSFRESTSETPGAQSTSPSPSSRSQLTTCRPQEPG